MFDKEFYPTPRHVLDRMGIDCNNKVVLEPSAGKGDIVDYCKEWGATDVLACEKNNDLALLVSRKARLIARDFFSVTKEQISHVDLIVMNPPFSNADRHILHAWEIAPEGCEIIALCNNETIRNHYHSGRDILRRIINEYGEANNLGDCFSTAERKTGVEVGMVHLFKPKVNNDASFDDFYLTNDGLPEDNAVIGYNEIRAVVNTYMAAVKCFAKVEEVAKELQAFTNVDFIGKQKEDGTYEKHQLKFGNKIAFTAGYNETICTNIEFAKAFQKECWGFIFRRVGIDKYVTRGVMEDINKFIENRKNYPFTVRNIGKMLDIIIGTRNEIMNRAIVEAVDNYTRHTHENRYGVEGWKTNEGHLLNQKFIVGYIAEPGYGGNVRFAWGRNRDELEDLTKAICYVTGTPYESIPPLHGQERITPNTWAEWGFFEYKLFKKGTGHFKFKDVNVWAQLNQAYAKIKGFQLPERFTHNKKQTA